MTTNHNASKIPEDYQVLRGTARKLRRSTWSHYEVEPKTKSAVRTTWHAKSKDYVRVVFAPGPMDALQKAGV